MNNNIKTESGNTGIVIAQIVEKKRLIKKNGEPFWLLKLSVRKSLTEMYFKLTGKEELTLKDNNDPIFVFSDKGRFINTLLPGNDYFFELKKSNSGEKDFFHAEDWQKLGDDRRLIERAWRLILNKGEAIEEELEDKSSASLSNQQLLQELEKRMKNGRIIVERDKQTIIKEIPLGTYLPNKIRVELSLITDLRDKESKSKVNLQLDEEEKNE